MRRIISLRWVVLTAWVVGLAALLFTSPDISQLVREKGSYALPDDYSTSKAGELEKEFSGKDTTTYVAIFHSDDGLSDKEMQAIRQTLQNVKNNKKRLKVESVTDSFDHDELEDQFLSSNKRTLMAALQVQNVNQSYVQGVRDKIAKQIKTNGVKTYLTGQELITNDMNQAAENGLHRTEGLTVAFILIVLLLVFRSVVAPIIPLVSVGVSYLTAQAVVAFLVKYIDFPISNFTQTFMVAVMFGIGTDYCILLMSRFKEELGKGADQHQATLVTFKTAGLTVLHSGIPVFIAFLSLSLTKFNLYRSAVAVGVGVVFLLIALFTLLPLFMVTLGNRLFWPMRSSVEEGKSDLWRKAGNLAFVQPLVALLIVALFTLPPIITYHGQLSFNSPEELANSYPAKKGYNVVSKDFGAGHLSPATIYLKNDDNMKTTEYVGLIERIAIELKKDPNVDQVMSISRPAGKRLDDIYVTKQADKLQNGLSDATKGLNTLQNSLKSTGKKVGDTQPQIDEARKNIGKLQNGTQSTQDGVEQLKEVLKQISLGIKSGASGADEMRKGVQDAQKKVSQLYSGEAQVLSGYRQVEQNLWQISNQLDSFTSAVNALTIDTSGLDQSFTRVEADLQAYANANPEMMQDPRFQRVLSDLQQTSSEAKKVKTSADAAYKQQIAQLNRLNDSIKQLADAMHELNGQSEKILNGIGQMQDGLGQLQDGLTQLEIGLNQLAGGQDQVVTQTSLITSALDQIESGQAQLQSGTGQVKNQVKDLSNGLNQGANGAKKIKNGVDSANDFIGNWTRIPYSNSGIYVPNEIFDNKDFKSAMDEYMSTDGKITKIQVTMKDDPYTNTGIAHFRNLKKNLPGILKGTKLENAHTGISGIASYNSDLKQLSSSDYQRAVALVVIGVFIALTVVLRSLSMPIYLMASLLLTYFSSMGFTELIFSGLFHYTGLTWTTQFFGFIVLVALGIDYSIFVMTRFNEYVNMAIKERMLLTLWHMGSVIFSAVIILSGTFAAMMPSGMLSLTEIATVVIIGLVLYATIIIPLFVPVMVKFFGRGNWWPFLSKKSVVSSDSKTTQTDQSI